MCFAVPSEGYEVDPALASAMRQFFILHADHEQSASTATMSRNGSLSFLARLMYSGMRSTDPISFNISSTASVAPPCTGPQRQAMPAEMQA